MSAADLPSRREGLTGRLIAPAQVQALEQEMAAYAQAESSPDGWVATVARDGEARLQGLLDEARQVRQTIGR